MCILKCWYTCSGVYETNPSFVCRAASFVRYNVCEQIPLFFPRAHGDVFQHWHKWQRKAPRSHIWEVKMRKSLLFKVLLIGLTVDMFMLCSHPTVKPSLVTLHVWRWHETFSNKARKAAGVQCVYSNVCKWIAEAKRHDKGCDLVDLSVLERKISTRQTREELIKKGVIIVDKGLSDHLFACFFIYHFIALSFAPEAQPFQMGSLLPVASKSKTQKPDLCARAAEQRIPWSS